MKVVIVHNIIAPYRIPLFNRLAASPGIDLTVLFMAESEANRRWDTGRLMQGIRFPCEILRGAHLRWGETTLHLNPGLISKLGSLQPDVVIVTSMSAATAMALAYRRFGGYRLVSWWAGTALTEARIGALKRPWRSILIPRMDAFLCYSRAATTYVQQTHFSPDRIYNVGNVTFDVGEFHRRVELARPRASEWRSQMGLQDAHVVLSVGQLVPRKNHRGLLEGFSRLQNRLGHAALVIVGEGPLRSELERLASDRRLRRVIFTGHVQPDELPLYYAAADLFVDLTLRDHWSQVVGEAMAAGLPALVSSADHASELIEDGVSGFVVDPADVEGVSSLAFRLFTGGREAKSVGAAGLDAVRQRDVRYTLRVFLDCLARLGTQDGLAPAPEVPG
jgi:glycosyltransferase involved in cell wall biosynthesis